VRLDEIVNDERGGLEASLAPQTNAEIRGARAGGRKSDKGLWRGPQGSRTHGGAISLEKGFGGKKKISCVGESLPVRNMPKIEERLRNQGRFLEEATLVRIRRGM